MRKELKLKKTRIVGGQKGNVEITLMAYIGKEKHYFLIDTGATCSFINKEFIEKHPRLKHFINESDLEYSVGGLIEEAKSIFNIELKLRFGKKLDEIEQEFIIIDHSRGDKNAYMGILGMDFFNKYLCIIDFEKNVLSYKGE